MIRPGTDWNSSGSGYRRQDRGRPCAAEHSVGERWLASGHHVKREFAQWREWIEAAQQSGMGMKRLLGFLRDDSEAARDWKGFSPFAGILSKRERQAFLCASMH
jgi:hypothetical protein